ncbi:MAG: hypothetical protein HQL80_13450, partial [Magnetococcales bacterium]|nr:hypothetical protein [Magnetococcales bacterium]
WQDASEEVKHHYVIQYGHPLEQAREIFAYHQDELDPVILAYIKYSSDWHEVTLTGKTNAKRLMFLSFGVLFNLFLYEKQQKLLPVIDWIFASFSLFLSVFLYSPYNFRPRSRYFRVDSTMNMVTYYSFWAAMVFYYAAILLRPDWFSDLIAIGLLKEMGTNSIDNVFNYMLYISLVFYYFICLMFLMFSRSLKEYLSSIPNAPSHSTGSTRQ